MAQDCRSQVCCADWLIINTSAVVTELRNHHFLESKNSIKWIESLRGSGTQSALLIQHYQLKYRFSSANNLKNSSTRAPSVADIFEIFKKYLCLFFFYFHSVQHPHTPKHTVAKIMQNASTS